MYVIRGLDQEALRGPFFPPSERQQSDSSTCRGHSSRSHRLHSPLHSPSILACNVLHNPHLHTHHTLTGQEQWVQKNPSCTCTVCFILLERANWSTLLDPNVPEHRFRPATFYFWDCLNFIISICFFGYWICVYGEFDWRDCDNRYFCVHHWAIFDTQICVNTLIVILKSTVCEW